MHAVVVHDLFAVDVDLAAVVAGRAQFVGAVAVDFEITIELEAEVVALPGHADIERGAQALRDRFHLVEIGELVPRALVVGIGRRAFRGGEFDADALQEIVAMSLASCEGAALT